MMEEIQVLNTMAVGYLEEETFSKAAEILWYGISKMKRCFLAPPSVIGGESKAQPSSPPSSSLSVYPAEWIAFLPEHSDFFPIPYNFECDLFDEPDEPSCLLSSQDHIFKEKHCLCCMMYNLGLAYHLAWQKQRNDCQASKLLLKASYMYQKAYAMVVQQGVQPQGAILEVLAAICTNASHCQSELANFQALREWNKGLKCLLELSSKTPKEEDDMEEEEDIVDTQRIIFQRSAALHSFGWVASPAA